MTREQATAISYDTSLEALTNPGAAGNFFQLHEPRSKRAWCAEFSRLVYADFATVLEPCLARIGFHLVAEPFDRAGTQAFLAAGPDFAVLTFRGSDDLNAWGTNLNAIALPWRGDGLVHRGFADALEVVWLDIAAALPKLTQPLLITGHSQGGALGTLTASLCPEAALYSFGAPRVGDRSFRAVMAERPGKAKRFVNNRDIVPRVPSARFGYRHTGRPYVIDEEGSVEQREPDEQGVTELLLSALPLGPERLNALFDGHLPRELTDHSPINYVSALR